MNGGRPYHHTMLANGAGQPGNSGGAADTIAISLNLPTEVATLVQQDFAAAHQVNAEPAKPDATQTAAVPTVEPKGKQQVRTEPIDKLSN
jgi:hypothetical protein